MKKINILEEQYGLIKEGLSKILYHFTSIENGYRICKSDSIYLQSSYAKDSDNYDRKRKFYLSCTRIRNSQFGYSKKFSNGGVRIVLDGDALAANFKGKQINYWGGGVFTDKYKYMQNVEKDSKLSPEDRVYQYALRRFKQKNPNASDEEIQNFIEHNFNDDAQHHIDNESEDRLFSYEPIIADAHRYIKSVDVLLVDFENDKEKMAFAQSFLYRTQLGHKYVRIFSSEKEFNNPNGKDSNDKVEYGSGLVSDSRISYYYKAKACLSAVICFIAYANHDFDKDNFARKTMEYLKKYELSEFKGGIGQIMKDFRSKWGLNGIMESLNAVRRDLSDEPNEYTYKIVKMLTDYMKSIGANSFKEGYKIKKNMEGQYYDYGHVYDRIDTSIKYKYMIIRDNVISLYPYKDKFRDALGWDNDTCKYNADAMTDEIMYYGYEKYNYNSKNRNSMFQYLYKLFRDGSIIDVYETLKKIGFDEDYLKSWDIDIRYDELDYWNAIRYKTVNAKRETKDTYDFSAASRITEKEVESFISKRQGKLG